MRTFKFADDDSYKFWKIELEGSSYTVTYGRIGTKGQTSTKSFATPDKAKTAYEKIIKEKLDKGYIETTPVQAAPAVEDALERALFDNPDDIAAHAAYADRLTQQGDPRGEFIQVQLQLDDLTAPAANRKKLQAREAELLKEHGRTWLGGLAEFLLDPKPVPEYRQARSGTSHRFAHGWLDSITTDALTVNFARALVKAPEIRLLRELRIENVNYEEAGSYDPGPDVPDNDYSPGASALQRLPVLPNLRIFFMGEPMEGDEYPTTHVNGQAAVDIVERMPNLEELYLLAHRVDLKRLFGLTTLPKLRILQAYHCNQYPLEVLAQNAAYSNVTHLLCFPHAFEPENDADEEAGAFIRLSGLKAVVRSPHLKKLTHLQLRLTNFGDAGIKEIVASGILSRLKVLDLYGGTVGDAGAKMLAKSPELKNLESLNLSCNQLTPDGIAVLTATGVKLAAKDQHAEGDDEFLFMGDME